MLILAIDTSSATGSVALRSEQGTIGLLTISVDLTHSEGLMPAVDTLMRSTGKTAAELTSVACVSGPGSYTGLRVGLASAQGLALPNRLPCVAFSSLDVLAHSLPHCQHLICPLLTARKGWVYARLYRWVDGLLKQESGELNVTVDELIKQIQEPAVLFGPGLPPHREMLKKVLSDNFIEVLPIFDSPRADLVAELAVPKIENGDTLDSAALAPYYLGPSQAEVNWKERQTKTIDS